MKKGGVVFNFCRANFVFYFLLILTVLRISSGEVLLVSRAEPGANLGLRATELLSRVGNPAARGLGATLSDSERRILVGHL